MAHLSSGENVRYEGNVERYPSASNSRLLQVVQIPDRDKFLMKVVMYGHDPESVDKILTTYRLEPKLIHVRRLIMKGRTTCLPVVLNHIKTWIIKDSFPDIIIQLIRGELLSNKIKIPSFPLIHSLLKDHDIDVNYCDIRHGTLLHVMSYFPSQQKEVCSFIESVMERYPDKLNIDQLSRKRRRTRDQFFQSTPLQFCIEKGCYDYAVFLILKGSRTDNLVFDKYSVRNDLMKREKTSYLRLMKILIIIGSLDVNQVLSTVKLTSVQKKYLMDACINRSLMELCCNVLRKVHPKRQQILTFLLSLEESIAIDPRVRQMMLMEHL